MRWINILIKKLHVCGFSKPIISRYISFNTRDIVYQCICGKRKIIREYRPFYKSFPIKTTPFLTHKDLIKIVNNKPNETTNQLPRPPRG